MELLALIGLIFVLWFLSGAFKKLSVWLTRTGMELTDYAALLRKQKIQYDRELRQQNKKVAENIQSIKKDGSDVIYHNQVRQEIEGLIKEVETKPNS